MRVVVVREDVGPCAAPDATDTVIQAHEVRNSLEHNGWNVSELILGADPTRLERDLRQLCPDVIFNLVESYLGMSSLASIGPAICRKLDIPFTGCNEAALVLAGDKMAARRVLQAGGLPMPSGASMEEVRLGLFPGAGTYIVKSRFEDASLGLGPDCVVTVDSNQELYAQMKELGPRLGRDCLAESFIAGREFNLALLAEPGGLMTLPLTEIVFDPEYNGPAIVDYAGKWDEKSTSFAASWRCFEIQIDTATQKAMMTIGQKCWNLFGLKGYARIDFRVDEHGTPYVIDINPNPCITMNSGFTAAAARAGLSHQAVVSMLVRDALKGSRGRGKDG